MKKSVFVVLMSAAFGIALLITSSCKKESMNNANGANTVTFKNQTYSFANSTTSDTTANNQKFVSLVASSAANINVGPQLQILLYPAVPLTSGTYTIMNGAAWAYNDTIHNGNAKQIMVAYSTANSLYLSTGGNGNQTVAVSVTNGNVSISGQVEMLGGPINSLAQDSTSLNLNMNASLPATSSANANGK